uniref:Retinal cone rhodopsin-sensitive cGMP 3',5'-cyclic phosphodiesterase subunit gamma n=1 Tax=Astyanax mexicanus TaxID=7994 RepID=A0A3B1IMV3_ASTMX
MNSAPASSALAAPAGGAGPTTPKKGPPKFKQRQTRTFKSKAPKPGQKGFGDDIPGMEGLGTGEHFPLYQTLLHTCRPSAPPLYPYYNQCLYFIFSFHLKQQLQYGGSVWKIQNCSPV